MSFSTLRSARKSKEAKSFIKEPIPNHSEASEPPQNPETHDKGQQSGSTAPLDDDSTCPIQNLPITGLPATLEIRQSPESGRGIYAKESLSIGSVLISLRPRVAVLSVPFLSSFCSSCSGPAPEDGLKRCTSCQTIWYCGATCQGNDWPLHKFECAALQKWVVAAPSAEVSVPSDAVRCIGRILWSVRKKGVNSSWTSELSMLQSHRTSLQPSTFESHAYLAHSLVRYLGVTSPEELAVFGLSSAADLVDLISRFTTNAFTLAAPSLTPIGVCHSPTLALVNHSCQPNAVIVFPRHTDNRAKEPNMQLIAIKPIDQGEQILISYVDNTQPRNLRQKALRETYNFTCKCTLCIQTDVTDPRSSLWCPKTCGGTCAFPIEENEIPRCSKCRAIVQNTDVVLDAVRIGQEALEKAMNVQSTDPAKAKQLTTNVIPILSRAGLNPSSHPLLAMIRLHQELLIASLPTKVTQEHLNQTIQTTAKYATALNNLLPYGHPVRAVALAELGKLLAVDEPSPLQDEGNTQDRFPPSGPNRLKMAYETLLRARNELLIGFGRDNDGGQVGKDIREAVVLLEKELGVWTEGIRNALEDVRAAKSR